ncbi:MAG: hypothetical protein QMD10_09560 [Desulfitobacteriaceae bacterium]|nr:hypothetical protein [Desulfitobacteriaceae bacterium]
MVRIKVGEWLRPSDVHEGDIVTIVNEGRNRGADETPFGREVFEIDVRLPSGEVKPWTMNRTTQRRCAEAWGDETKGWVDKPVRIQLREQSVRGIMKTVIYGVPIKEELPAAEVKPVAPSEAEEGVTLTLTREEAERLKALLGKK